MVLYADVPGVDASLLSAIIDSHRHFRSTDPAYGALVVTGSRSNSFNPASENYGRIIRDEVNPSCIREIVEKKQIDQLLEGDPRRRTLEEIDEFNSGIFVARAPALFRALGNAPPRQVGADRVEFYATDFVEHMVSRGLHVYAWQAPAEFQYKIEGANTIEELEEISQRRCTSAEPFRTQ
jgi:bifunctional N-acetylglucosamine-1-phosphate-uridyltransferase/glucosamine-1-phosphate-acetyltransferase GlmU-like protein